MTEPRYTFIDADTHVTEARDVWTSRVPSKWKDRVPRVERDPATNSDIWYIGDRRMAPVGITAVAGWPEPIPKHPPRYEDAHPGAYDAKARLQYMDETGVWAQVLYPNIGGFGSQLFLGLDDAELKLACVRAYNDFLIDWIEPDPRRFVPIMATPFWDIEAAVREVERCAARGHRGVLFTGEPQFFGLPLLGDHHWDPLWAAAQAAGLPISFHLGSGEFLENFTPERLRVDGVPANFARTGSALCLENGVQLADLLLSGVLPRFPELKFVSVESGIGWIPFLLEAVDYQFEQMQVRLERPEFELRPSEYFRRQVYGCYWFEKIGPQRLLDLVGVDNIMFETDFPHPTCLYGNVQETIEESLGHVSEEVRRRILYDNAAELYRIEGPSAEA